MPHTREIESFRCVSNASRVERRWSLLLRTARGALPALLNEGDLKSGTEVAPAETAELGQLRLGAIGRFG